MVWMLFEDRNSIAIYQWNYNVHILPKWLSIIFISLMSHSFLLKSREIFSGEKNLYGETNINSVIVCLSNLFIFSSRNFHWECDCNYGCGWKWIYHWNFFDLPKQGFLKWCIACHDDILCILSKKGIVLFV